MAKHKDVKGFALSKKFLHGSVFPQYPEIFAKIKSESYEMYKKNILKPIYEHRKHEITQMNKKSTYRQIQL